MVGTLFFWISLTITLHRHRMADSQMPQYRFRQAFLEVGTLSRAIFQEFDFTVEKQWLVGEATRDIPTMKE